MADSITASVSINASAQKTVDTGDPTAPTLSLLNSIGGFQAQYGANSDPDATQSWSGEVALVAGAKTLDLTALTQAGVSGAIDMTGKKLRYIFVIADSANANPISIGEGASNGYDVFGDLTNINASDPRLAVTLSATAVDGTHKTLDLAGTGTQVLNVLMVFGT